MSTTPGSSVRCALPEPWVRSGTSPASQHTEGRTWLGRTLAGRDGVAPAVQAKALLWAGWPAFAQTDPEHASRVVEESLGLYRQGGNKHREAWALGNTFGIRATIEAAASIAPDQEDYPHPHPSACRRAFHRL